MAQRGRGGASLLACGAGLALALATCVDIDDSPVEVIGGSAGGESSGGTGAGNGGASANAEAGARAPAAGGSLTSAGADGSSETSGGTGGDAPASGGSAMTGGSGEGGAGAGEGGAAGSAGTDGEGGSTSGAGGQGDGGSSAGQGGDGGSAGSGNSGSGGSTGTGGSGAASCGGFEGTLASFALWPMPNTPGEGLPNPQQYTVLNPGGDEVVRDEVTGLEWQRVVSTDVFAWDQAVAHCEALELATQTDWRLPEMVELVSILNYGNQGPAIDETAFPNALPQQPGPNELWTATPSSPFTSSDPWSVEFNFGQTSNGDAPNIESLVRCVRGPIGAGPSACRFTISGGTVTDQYTGLTWQRDVAPGTYTWEDAKAHCPTVSTDGGGWRLPSVKELVTLIDNTRYNPAIEVSTFLGTNDATWSATEYADSPPVSAWNVRFYLGRTDLSLPTTSTAQVRCVRSAE